MLTLCGRMRTLSRGHTLCVPRMAVGIIGTDISRERIAAPFLNACNSPSKDLPPSGKIPRIRPDLKPAAPAFMARRRWASGSTEMTLIRCATGFMNQLLKNTL